MKQNSIARNMLRTVMVLMALSSVSFAATPKTVQINGSINAPDGSAYTATAAEPVVIIIKNVPGVADTGNNSSVHPYSRTITSTDTSNISITLVANSGTGITPSGSYYEVETKVPGLQSFKQKWSVPCDDDGSGGCLPQDLADMIVPAATTAVLTQARENNSSLGNFNVLNVISSAGGDASLTGNTFNVTLPSSSSSSIDGVTGLAADTQTISIRGSYNGTAYQTRDLHLIAGTNTTINSEQSSNTLLVTVSASGGGGSVASVTAGAGSVNSGTSTDPIIDIGALSPLVANTDNVSLLIDEDSGVVVNNGRLSLDSDRVTPAWVNVQGRPNVVSSITDGIATQVAGSSTAPSINVDSGSITPSWNNVQSKPNVVQSLTDGIATQVGGTSTSPQVNVDSSAITPTWTNVQSKPNLVEGLDAGVATQVGGTSTRPVVNVDSSTITPSWTNLQGRPNVVEGIDAGVNTQVGGTSTRPVINVDSSTITASYALLQGGLVDGTATQIGGTSTAPRVNVDSSAITPTWDNVQSKPNVVTGLGSGVATQVGGTSTTPIVNVDSSAITPTWTNIQGAMTGDLAGTSASVTVSKIQGYSLTYPTNTPLDGQVWAWDYATQAFVLEAQSGGGGGGGTVNSVTAGTGLTDSGTAADPVMNVIALAPLVASSNDVSLRHFADSGLVLTDNNDLAIDSARVTPVWDNIQSKPSVFTPDTHTHNIDGFLGLAYDTQKVSMSFNLGSETMVRKLDVSTDSPVSLGYQNTLGGSAGDTINVTFDVSLLAPLADSSGVSLRYFADTGLVVSPNNELAIASERLTPTWENIQGKPSVVSGLVDGIATQVSGTSTAYQVNTDSSAITPSWTNIQGRPNTIEGIDAGVNTQVGGTSTRPVVNVDSSSITPSWTNVQGSLTGDLTGTTASVTVSKVQGYGFTYPTNTPVDDYVWAWDASTQAFILEAQANSGAALVNTLTAGNGLVNNGTGSDPVADVVALAPLVANSNDVSLRYFADTGLVLSPNNELAIDSDRITPAWVNVQGKPANTIVQINDGIATQVSGSSTAPQINVDSSAITPSYAKLQGGLVAGISTQVGGTSSAPQINVDSATITPSYGMLQGGLVDGTATQVAGTSNAPKINVDSSAITPTWTNVQGSLTGDLTGTSASVTVSKVQGYPLTYPSSTLNDNQVWAWDYASQAFTIQDQNVSDPGQAQESIQLALKDGFITYEPAPPVSRLTGSGNSTKWSAYSFDDSTDEFVGFEVLTPGSLLPTGNATVTIFWTPETAAANDVKWNVATFGVADGESYDQAAGSSTVVDTGSASTQRVMRANITQSLATWGWNANELLTLNLSRDADHGSDTLVGDAHVIGVEVTFDVNSTKDDYLLAAAKADMEASTTTSKASTPGTQHYHPAHAKFVGLANTTGGSGEAWNVASITDHGTGDMQVNLTNAMTASDYPVLVSVYNASTTVMMTAHIISMSTTLVRFKARQVSTGSSTQATTDPSIWYFAGFGDQ